MKEFDRLLSMTEHLLGPEGCPWDRAQTMASTRSCVIEESSELVEAIDLEDNVLIREELGDLFFVVLFLCKLAEKENRCSFSEVLHELNEKLHRRHPHVFGDAKVHDVEELLKLWKEIKKSEKGKENRKSSLDGIPSGLPALTRAQKVYKRVSKFTDLKLPLQDQQDFHDEKTLSFFLWGVAAKAQNLGLDAEHALRKFLTHLETEVRTQGK